MKMTPVQSSNIAAIGYDKETKKMRVKFTGGNLYEYHGVEPHIHTNMLAHESPGKFFARDIRGQYAYEKVTDE